jgi:hypothetical protein
MSRLLSIAAIFFCFEIGLFLVLIPWSELWEANGLLYYIPNFKRVILHDYFRAGVTTLGAVDILIGISELRHFVRSLRIDRAIE